MRGVQLEINENYSEVLNLKLLELTVNIITHTYFSQKLCLPHQVHFVSIYYKTLQT